ncbi:hypothetical protein ILYODFUR_009270 [Ilyodon furcidens]|uniref:Uncharacterized protein n=1 Tax=Ilyodon furcidens TaxID=33524 RepID=A0ABV0UQD9_9TELE
MTGLICSQEKALLLERAQMLACERLRQHLFRMTASTSSSVCNLGPNVTLFLSPLGASFFCVLQRCAAVPHDSRRGRRVVAGGACATVRSVDARPPPPDLRVVSAPDSDTPAAADTENTEGILNGANSHRHNNTTRPTLAWLGGNARLDDFTTSTSATVVLD